MNFSFDPRRIEILEPEVVAMLKAKSPTERLRMAMELQKLARQVLFARVQSQHPNWTTAEVDSAVARRMMRGEL